MGRKSRYDEKLVELSDESSRLYFYLLNFKEERLPELCELLITFSMNYLLSLKQKDIKDADIDDFIEANQIALALLEDLEERTRH